MSVDPSCGGTKVWLNADEPNDDCKLYAVSAVPAKAPGVTRVWVDGCFDMLHFGHTNAIRQAAALGHELFVGSHSDEEIVRYKGPPIMHAEERYEALRACKWVTFVVENYPYVTRLKDMERLDVDFVVHGDDISVGLDGKNSYQEMIDAGKFKVVKRTAGISTTDLVGRMLLCTKQHLLAEDEEPVVPEEQSASTTVRYLTTNRKIVQFSNNKAPTEEDRIVYVDGSFDLFHVGHVRVLEKARAAGSYVIVGLHEDSVVNEEKGSNYPIMNMNERVLGVLSCRFVDEVVMGVPYRVTEEVLDSLNVDVVVGGASRFTGPRGDPYVVPKAKGIFQEVSSGSELTTDSVIERVMENRAAFLTRQKAKNAKDKKGEETKAEEYRNVREVQ
jgi:ethanolamine-phosphate cytidylyltransferase